MPAGKSLAHYCRSCDAMCAGCDCSGAGGACCAFNPCGYDWSSGGTEISYVQTLRKHFAERAAFTPRFVIDTSRNGVPEARGRAQCDKWCNVSGASLGHAR